MKKVGVLAGGIVVLLAAFGYSRIIYSPPIERTDESMPFFWGTKGLNKTLHNYLSNLVSDHVYVITGAPQSGKSRILSILAKEMRDQGRLVIHIGDSLELSLIDSLAEFKPYITGSQVKILSEQAPYNSSLVNPFAEENGLRNIYQELKRGFDMNNETKLMELVSYINSLAPVVKPCVFVDKAERFMSESLLTKLVGRRTVPIIMETSSYPFDILPMGGIRVVQIDTKSDMSQFLLENKVFSPLEMKKISSVFGTGSGAIFASIFEALRYSYPLSESIQELYEYYRDTIETIHMNRTKEFCSKNGKLSVNSLDEIKPLLDSKLFYYDGQVRESIQLVSRVLCDKQN